jgi:hypothetical protein
MVLIAYRRGREVPGLFLIRFYAQLSGIFTLYGKGQAGALVSFS